MPQLPPSMFQCELDGVIIVEDIEGSFHHIIIILPTPLLPQDCFIATNKLAY
ncbi:hypothetical protein YC2023_115764 [Brassica napus]